MVFELTAIDRHFAEFISNEAGGLPAHVRRVVALASNAVGNGHICLNLADIADRELLVDGEEVRLPPTGELESALRAASVVGSPGDYRPLVLDGAGRLYLHRYWQYERDLARVILAKAASPGLTMDEELLGQGLGRLFPGGDGVDWQKVAALAALRKNFCVISGGPGTGKTSTVVKILALLLEQAKGAPLRIALAAPTGKSAARLKESISGMKEQLACAPAIRELIPHEVSTIHRLLGPIAGSVRFRHGAENPLPFDVVIVDEASMVALPLMAKLATALRPHSRLILLGDRDQLASVEAGAVLGDVCGGGRQEPFSAAFAELHSRLADAALPTDAPGGPLPPLSDSLVILKKNYRFREESGIGAVGRAVNAGAGADAITLLKGGNNPDVLWRDSPAPDSLKRELSPAIVEGYGPYLAASTAMEALRLFDRFRVLSPLRQGACGVAGINLLVEEILAEKGLIDPRNRWYQGRPVLITVNDYNLKLFNGDVGIVFPDPEAGGTPRVFFPLPDGGVRKVSPIRLPAHETVYGMTIHKSQGTEIDRILMLLPNHDSEVLTRELIYTGITRARKSVEIWGDEEIFVAAVARRVERNSGLKDALWCSV